MQAISWCSVFTFLLGVAGWIANEVRKRYAAELVNADGSPSIDESVTRPMLAMAKTCATLCDRIYGRVEDLRTLLAVDGWLVDAVIVSRDLSAVCAVLFRDDGPAPSCIVVWRGTNPLNREQLKSNSQSKLIPLTLNLPGADGANFNYGLTGLIHRGLCHEFCSVSDELLATIKRHVRAGRKVYVTGHSQGGGLACITVAAMRSMSKVTDNCLYRAAGLITFGCLRPGNAAFCDYVTKSIMCFPSFGEFGVQRYRNNNDIVPLLPFYTRGYRHCGDELYIWPHSAVTRNPCWPVKLAQHVIPYLHGVYGDGLRDHAMAEYLKHVEAVQIPEPGTSDATEK